MNGAPASLASRRAISVFPTPVGPMRMMLFGEICVYTNTNITVLEAS